MNHSDGHFDEMTGLLYLEGQLDPGRASEVSAHLGSCVPCREIVHALETEGVWLREALAAEDESIPARVIAAPERGTAHWGWIAAFALGTGGDLGGAHRPPALGRRRHLDQAVHENT